MTEVEWTNEQVIRLIAEYRKRPLLWDSTHNKYRVQSAKYEAWNELAEMFNCEITDLRKKFNSVFASHRREIGRVKGGTKSTWFLYPYMSFLPNHLDIDDSMASPDKMIRTRTKHENVTIIDEARTSDEYEDNEGDEPLHIIIKEEPIIEEPIIPKIMRNKKHQKQRLKRVLKRRIITDDRPRIPNKVFKKPDDYKGKDECDTFGEYIAMSLRKHDERTRSMIKQAINNILFEQEMKKYSSDQYAVVLTTDMEENPLIIGNDCEK